MTDKEEYYRNYVRIINGSGTPSSEDIQQLLGKFWLYFVRRTISRYKFQFEFEREYIWIENKANDDKLGHNVSRIIYMRE